MKTFKIAIIDENALSAMALRSILNDIFEGAEVEVFSSAQPLEANSQNDFIHYFASVSAVFNSLNFFMPLLRKTIVLSAGSSQLLDKYGFRSVNVNQSEKEVLKSLLGLHKFGHPHGIPHVEEIAKTDESALSQREVDVLKLVVKGFINKEIAEKLCISLATVAFHRNNISTKLGSRSVGHLTVYAVLHGIVKIEEL